MRVLDLFCGAGGLACGFKDSGFDVLGVDNQEHAGRTFTLNQLGGFKLADLRRELVLGDFEIIVGGPPCRPWSTVNTRKRATHHPDYELINKFFAHICKLRPLAFVMENVPPLRKDLIFHRNIRRVCSLGYTVDSAVIRYCDYGAPTLRRRLIVFGTRKGNDRPFFSELQKKKRGAQTVRDAIWSLRHKRWGEVPDHVWPPLRTIEKYRQFYASGKFGWYILDWDKPAPSFGNIMKTYILHPDAFNGGETRVISVKEAMCLMGFDEKFRFPADTPMHLRYQMVADAVSPLFSEVVAETLKSLL